MRPLCTSDVLTRAILNRDYKEWPLLVLQYLCLHVGCRLRRSSPSYLYIFKWWSVTRRSSICSLAIRDWWQILGECMPTIYVTGEGLSVGQREKTVYRLRAGIYGVFNFCVLDSLFLLSGRFVIPNNIVPLKNRQLIFIGCISFLYLCFMLVSQ